METATMQDSRMSSFIHLYDMHTDYFKRALEGISDANAHQRLNTKANHVAWLAGSLVQERFEMVNMLNNTKLHQHADELFREHKGIQEGITYPSLETYKTDWDKITPTLRYALKDVSTEMLDSTFEMMPGMKFTYYEYISFLIYREANCIGQIALWRRLLGYPALKYD